MSEQQIQTETNLANKELAHLDRDLFRVLSLFDSIRVDVALIKNQVLAAQLLDLQSQAQQAVESVVADVVLTITENPEGNYLPTAELLAILKETYGLSLMQKIAVPLENIRPLTSDLHWINGTGVNIEQFILQRAAFIRMPLADQQVVSTNSGVSSLDTNSNNHNLIFGVRSQGRTSNATLENPIVVGNQTFHDLDIKGNGLGGDYRDKYNDALSPQQTFISSSDAEKQRINAAEFDSVYGLLSQSEADLTVAAEEANQEWQIFGEQLLAVANPVALPDKNGQLASINDLKQEGNLLDTTTDFQPVFLIRLWRNNTSLAELLAAAFPTTTLNRSWEDFLVQKEKKQANSERCLQNQTDEQIKEIIAKLRKTSLPVINRMRDHYQQHFDQEPTNQQLFDQFYQHHISNYRKLINHDLVHGALHQQNIKVEGEWGDKVTVLVNQGLDEEEKKKLRIKDFLDCFHSVSLMAVALGVGHDLSLEKFYHEVLVEAKPLIPDAYPAFFKKFIYQDVGSFRSVDNVPTEEAISKGHPDPKVSEAADIRNKFLLDLEVNIQRLTILAELRPGQKKLDIQDWDLEKRSTRRIYNAVFFSGDAYTQAYQNGVLFSREINGITFQLFVDYQTHYMSSRVLNNSEEIIDFDDVIDILIDLDKT